MRTNPRIKTVINKWHLLTVAMALLIAVLATSATPILASSAPAPITTPLVLGYTYEPGTAHTYFDIILDGGPAQAGWCVDYLHNITICHHYTATVYDYFGQYYPDPGYLSTLPASVQAVNWFAITYIINHKIGNWNDIQNAIWYFTDARPYAAGSKTATMVNEAKNYLLSNGGVYTPDDGDLAPMVCYISGTQLIFFEYPFVKPSEPLPELPTALLFGLGLLGIGGFVVIKRRTKAGTGK